KAYFHLPYRQTEGVVRAHAANKIPSIPDYSTINRRLNKLDIEINEHVGNEIVITLDSTGIKVANKGEWMRHKWHVRKGYLKIHVAVDIKKKRILSLEVTSEEVHDGKMLKKLVDNVSENNETKRELADGMYDSNNNFRYLSKNHIKPGIKTRRNSKVKSTNCNARNISVLKQQTNLKRWKHSVRRRYHVTITVMTKSANAPMKGLKLNSIPSARPGRATCESASPTKAICFDTMIDPR